MNVENEAKFNKDLFLEYKTTDRYKWAAQAADDIAFENGAIFTQGDAEALKKNNVPVPSINALKDGISQLVAQLTANKPRFSATARENSDVSLAGTYADLFSYIWDISSGNRILKRAIKDYEIVGIGALMAYVDWTADNGKGEILIKDIDPQDLFIDPNSREPDSSDAAHIFTVQQYSQRQIENYYPDFDFEGAESTQDNHHVRHLRSEENDQTLNVNRFNQFTDKKSKIYDVIDRYTKIRVPYYHLFDKFSRYEAVLPEEDYKEYLERIAVTSVHSNGETTYTTNQTEVRELLKIIDVIGNEYMISPDNGLPTAVEYLEDGTPLGVVVRLEPTTIKNLVDNDIIIVNEVPKPRIKRVMTIGNKLFHQEIMPIENYPIVTFMLHHNRNPYAYGDVRMCKSLVEQLNKVESIIITHAMNSANMKVFVPEGFVDKDDLKKRYNKPGSQVFFYHAEDGSPGIQFAVPPPLANEVYIMRQNYIEEIQRELGAFAFQSGDVTQAPPTARGTLLVDEMGQRRSRSKRDDIEEALNQLAKPITELIPHVYTEEKIIRVVEPNHKTRFSTINEYNGSEIINDVVNNHYDIKIISGSMLPSNRWGRADYYLELYKLGILQDKSFIIRESELPNAEDILEREDTINQLTGIVKALEQQIKNLEGQLQSKSREVIQANEKVDIQKTKSELERFKLNIKSQVDRISEKLNALPQNEQEKI